MAAVASWFLVPFVDLTLLCCASNASYLYLSLWSGSRSHLTFHGDISDCPVHSTAAVTVKSGPKHSQWPLNVSTSWFQPGGGDASVTQSRLTLRPCGL